MNDITVYDTLCVIRTSLLNAVGSKFILGGNPLNITKILTSIVSELAEHTDFIEEIYKMPEYQLYDLGFEYLHSDDNLMLFPVWLYPFIPDDACGLVDLSGSDHINGDNEVTIYSDHWISIGFYYNFG